MHASFRVAVRGAAVLALAGAVAATGSPGLVVAQGAAPGGPAVVANAEPLLLREQPGYDAVALGTVNPGEPVEVVGDVTYGADGNVWVPVAVAGQTGFLPAGAVVAPAAASEAASVDAAAPVAEPQPGLAPEGPAAAPVPDATGSDAAPPDTALAPPAPDTAAAMTAPAPGASVTTTADVNLRSGPSYDADVLAVLPPGAAVSVDGDPVAGFVPVTAGGISGWMDAQYLGAAGESPATPAGPAAAPETSSAPTGDAAPPLPEPVASGTDASPSPANDAPRERERGSAGVIWPFSGGRWHVIQGYNNGTHQNRSGFAQYKYALDWARIDGDTAGQPIHAPAAGTVKWTDPGSGGILIDLGDGYGVALFHLTIDGVGRGDRVEQGQRIGVVSGPGGPGYMSTAHVDMTLWKLSPSGGHEAAPWVGPHAIAGQEFPDDGGANQHMGVEVTP